MNESTFIWRFTPSQTHPELLESIFVQREDLLQNLFEQVEESVLTNNKHYALLIGPRGIGKTHLVSLLHHRLTQNEKLSKQLRIAWFLEDETITSFVQLLKRIYELLSAEDPEEFPLQWLVSRLENSPEQIEKELRAELVRKFHKHTLLLLIENLDYLFDGLKTEGQRKWRAFLQEHPFTCIVATSQRLFDDMQKRQEPFFGFFSTTHLKPLEVDDAIELLSRIAEKREQTELSAYLNTPEGRSRCRALHHIAGGNHRIYIVLSEFISRKSLDELTQPFVRMADELTPYYQERMRWLSPQQRQIVELLCNQETTCTPKKIAQSLLAKENTISSQLKKLLDLGYVIKTSRGRESLYELAEPLMRLASEVKEKRQKPLRLLVDFLRIWYRPEQLPGMLEAASNQALRDHLTAAIADCENSPDPLLTALFKDIEQAEADGNSEELIRAREELAYTRDTAEDWWELGNIQEKSNYYEAAAKSFERSLQIDSKNAFSWSSLGYCWAQINHYEAAKQCFEKAIEIDPSTPFYHSGKGHILILLEQTKEALESFQKAIDLDPDYVYGWAGIGRASFYLKRYDEAIGYFKKAVELEPKSFDFKKILCTAFLATSRWHEFFITLEELLMQDAAFDTELAGILLAKIGDYGDALTREQYTVKLFDMYMKANALTNLGDGLIRGLRLIDREKLNTQALMDWRDLWSRLGAEHVELELPLRLLKVGVEYLIQDDRAVLADLIASERRILEQAFGLESL